jgi:hypothetical protein
MVQPCPVGTNFVDDVKHCTYYVITDLTNKFPKTVEFGNNLGVRHWTTLSCMSVRVAYQSLEVSLPVLSNLFRAQMCRAGRRGITNKQVNINDKSCEYPPYFTYLPDFTLPKVHDNVKFAVRFQGVQPQPKVTQRIGVSSDLS